MFDNICKFLAENFSSDFATWLLGEPITLTELSPKELSLEPIRKAAPCGGSPPLRRLPCRCPNSATVGAKYITFGISNPT